MDADGHAELGYLFVRLTRGRHNIFRWFANGLDEKLLVAPENSRGHGVNAMDWANEERRTYTLAGPSLKEKVHPLTESHVRALRGVPAEALQRCVKVAETAPLCRFGDGFLAIHSVRSCCKKPSCGRSSLWLTPMPRRARIIACNQLANRGDK